MTPWPDQFLLPSQGITATVGRSSNCVVVLRHPSVSSQHCALHGEGDGTRLEDLNSRFGTFVNGARIKVVVLKPGDVVWFADSPHYVVKDGTLIQQSEAGGFDLELRDVGVVRQGLTLLQDLGVSIPGGTFVGVLGPSGAGKSLLVGCLSSTITPDVGGVFFDRGTTVAGHEELFRSRLGIVTQEDLVHDTLTVEENLVLSGRLRLPALSETELQRRVEETLDEVDLARHRQKLVKVLSGGQRKRVSIAIELLMRPQFIILDEPTSGVDPGVSAKLMDVLRGLARKGITIVCTTHTLDTMNFFDAVLVLGLKSKTGQQNKVGTLAYYGPPGNLYANFQVRNAADLFEKLQELRPTAISHAPTKPEEVDDSREMDSGGERPRFRDGLVLQRRAAQAGFAAQLQVVITRGLLAFWRDAGSLALNVIQPVALAVLTVLAQHQAPESVFIHFFLVVSALWMGMTLTVREIVREQKLYVRDRLVSLSPLAYIAGKILTAEVILIPVEFILYASARLTYPIFLKAGRALDHLQTASWLGTWFVLWLTGLGGALVGLMISTWAKTERVAVMVLPIALLLQVMLSRVVFGHGVLPWTYLSPFAPLNRFNDYLSHADATWQGLTVFWGSAGMITRPATTVMDLAASGMGGDAGITTEWTYLIGLFVAYLVATVGCFLKREGRWIGELR